MYHMTYKGWEMDFCRLFKKTSVNSENSLNKDVRKKRKSSSINITFINDFPLSSLYERQAPETQRL